MSDLEVTANILTTGVPSPWIDVEDYASFIAAIDAIGATERTLLISSEKAVADDKTVPSNVTLKFLQGGSLNIANTKTVTINGHVEAGLYQIFKGDGSAAFGSGSVKEVYPEWWGIDGAADEVEINKALTAFNTVVLCKRTYITAAAICIPSNRMIIFLENAIVKLGDGAGSPTGGKQIFTNADWTNGNSNIHIINPEIDGNKANNANKSAIAFDFRGVDNLKIIDPVIYDIPDRGSLAEGDGIYLARASGGAHNDFVTIRGGKTSGCMRNGLSIIDARYSEFDGIKFETNFHSGLCVEPNGANDRIVQLAFSNIHVKGSDRYGFIFKNANSGGYGGIVGSNLTAEGCGFDGFLISDIDKLMFSSITARNNSQDTTLTYQGIYLNNASNNVIASLHSTGSDQQYGAKEAGTSDYNKIFGTELGGNGTGTYLFTGSNSILNQSGVDKSGLQKLSGNVGSATWDPGSIANGAEEAKEVAVTGAALGDFAVASFSLDILDLVLNAQVTAANKVTCILANNTGGAIDLGSGTIRVKVIRQ